MLHRKLVSISSSLITAIPSKFLIHAAVSMRYTEFTMLFSVFQVLWKKADVQSLDKASTIVTMMLYAIVNNLMSNVFLCVSVGLFSVNYKMLAISMSTFMLFPLLYVYKLQ